MVKRQIRLLRKKHLQITMALKRWEFISLSHNGKDAVCGAGGQGSKHLPPVTLPSSEHGLYLSTMALHLVYILTSKKGEWWQGEGKSLLSKGRAKVKVLSLSKKGRTCSERK